ncbi:uncharacterized protein LOC125804898 [Astyanax mexicanus]|uniref:uncharacterized protein LOC125804898 n=1 Tax=Astyanax mexicanus TaxID=7994 RepID=UPI0020CAE62E|nr:uncharacterized protein LOC125804898 [Astyanax mexicanus]
MQWSRASGFRFAMAESSRRCYCSVPACSNSKQRHPYLSFHDFPKDEGLRKSWVRLIRRDEGPFFNILRGSTHVCSLHFDSADIYVSKSGRKRLKPGALPRRFAWNNWGKDQTSRESAFDRARARLGVDVRAENVATQANHTADEANQVSAVDEEDELQPTTDHNYCACSHPSGDSAAERIRELEARVRELESQLQDMSATTLQINRYCSTDEEFRFYTRFTSEKVFLIFWDSVTPSASRLVYWSKAQRVEDVMEIEKPSPNRRLALVDEFFMYCCRVAVGLKEKVLADIFGVSTATVSRVIITWANYLYLVLGSMPIWMSREQVQATMPEKFTRYCSNVRVILDCTEVRCETPSSLTLQSETFSAYKNHTTFKALIGVAPCGVITFVSKLFTGSISDQEITRQSGILTLLEPGDACMADKGFIIDQMLSEVGASLIIPPFKRGTCFSKEETEKTQAIARLRILVERAIRRVKEYHIWDTTIPLTLSGSVNQLWTNCCLMTNYQGPLEKKSNLPV